MKKSSAKDRIIRKSRAEIQRMAPDLKSLARLRAIRDDDIDTSDIPEDPEGIRHAPQPGSLRMSVFDAMRGQRLTAYALWKRARKYCGTIPQSAVYEFLRGRRAIGLEYIEALVKALDLVLVPKSKKAG